MKKTMFLVICFLFALCCHAEITPQKIKVGFFHYDGYHMIDSYGEKSGYGYEYLQKMAFYTDCFFEYIGYEKSWSDMLKMLECGEIDLITGADKSSERLNEFDYSDQPIAMSYTILTVKAGCEKYSTSDFSNWNGIRVGMLEASSRNQPMEAFAREKKFTWIPVYYKDLNSLLADLKSEKNIDAAISSSMRTIQNEWIYTTFDPAPLYIIVRKGNRKLLDQLNTAIAHLDKANPRLMETLWKKYYALTGGREILFSPEEQAFIKKANLSGEVFNAVVNPDRVPLSFFENGQLRGIIGILMDMIIDRTGLNIRIIRTADRTEYQEALLRKDISIQLDAWHNYSMAEGAHFNLTEPYLSVSVSKLRLKNNTGKIKKIGCVKGADLLHRLLREQKKHGMVICYDSISELVQGIKNKEIDFACLYSRSAELEVYKDPKNMLVSEFMEQMSTDFAIGIRNTENLLLASILEKAVNSLNPKDINAALEHYSSYPPKPFSFIGLIYTHPIPALGIPFLLLLFCTLFLGVLILKRRDAYRNTEVVRCLPLQIIVADANGHVYHVVPGDYSKVQNLSKIHNLSQFKNKSRGTLILEAIRSSLAVNQQITRDYTSGETTRSALVTPLPYSVFNAKTAIWISQDTTELQNAKDELKTSAARLYLTLQSIGDGVLVTDETETVTIVNPVAMKLIGLPAQQIIGRKLQKVFRLVHYDSEQPMESPVEKALKTGKIVEMENHIDLISQNGKRFHIADCAAPIRKPNGKIVGAVLVFRDVTQEYEQKILLENAMKAAQSADRAKSYFLATVSHEIRTPLNAVIGFTELLRTGKLSVKEQAQYLEAISSSGNALLTLINDILDLSRLEAGQMPLAALKTNLDTLFTELKNIFSQKTTEKGLELNIDNAKDLPEVYVDTQRLRQVLLNLIGNAIKFTNKGSVAIRANFQPEPDQTGTLIIEVADTGIGISPAYQKEIFLPFSQQDPAYGNHKYGGTGLGLTISLRLVENMGGTLTVKSTLEVGSTFTICLKKVRYESPQKLESALLNLPVKNSEHSLKEKLKILLVDDVPMNLQVLSAIFRRLQFESVSADSASRALELMEKNSFDLVITDLWMPDMNGGELAEIIRKKYRNSVRIVAITADFEYGESFDLKNFDAIILKPATTQKIEKMLTTLQETSALSDSLNDANP